MNKRFYAIAIPVFIIIGFALWRMFKNSQPIYTTGRDVPDISRLGNPDQAMQQAKDLLTALKNSDGDWSKVPQRLMRLPDQSMAENPLSREKNVSGFSTPSKHSAQYKEIYFFSDVYLRRNVKQYKGDRTTASPSGFYIVGYRNGDVRQVPPENVRLSPSGSNTLELTFPGMTSYNPAGQKLPWFGKK